MAAICLLASSDRIAAAADRPIAGRRLCLQASESRPERRHLRFTAVDPSISAPFPDPGSGASLVISNSSAAGQCFAEIPLHPNLWTPLRRNGARHGYLYRASVGGGQWAEKVRIRPGKITLRAGGPAFPCALDAEAQDLPINVQLRIGSDRYCAAFDGNSVARNRSGRFRAELAAPPAECPDDDLTVANLNILHGLPCPDPDHCRLPERIALLFQWVAQSGCPDVVTLQEVVDLNPTFTALPLIAAHLTTTCPFPYSATYFRTFGIDDEMILSRYPVLNAELHSLRGNFRHVTYARIDHPIGPVDVFTTHLASSADGATQPCAVNCPSECVSAGALTHRDCQAVQTALLVEARHDVDTPAVITGDFNDSPGSFVYEQFVGRGWTDVHLAAGNPECMPSTGAGCTSGRADSLLELESPQSNLDERIDFIFLVPPAPGSVCSSGIDSLLDDDGDGTATKVFAGEPNPFAPTCGPAPDPICWPSDHAGVELDLNCGL